MSDIDRHVCVVDGDVEHQEDNPADIAQGHHREEEGPVVSLEVMQAL